jgi:hypothetical protein
MFRDVRPHCTRRKQAADDTRAHPGNTVSLHPRTPPPPRSLLRRPDKRQKAL